MLVFSINLVVSGNCCNFAAHTVRRSPVGTKWAGSKTFWKMRLSTLFLDTLKLRKLHEFVRTEATVDAYVVCINPFGVVCKHVIDNWYILREASAVVRPTNSGNAKASRCGTGNRYDSHAFFVCSSGQANIKNIEQ